MLAARPDATGKGGHVMRHSTRVEYLLGLAVLGFMAASVAPGHAQAISQAAVSRPAALINSAAGSVPLDRKLGAHAGRGGLGEHRLASRWIRPGIAAPGSLSGAAPTPASAPIFRRSRTSTCSGRLAEGVRSSPPPPARHFRGSGRKRVGHRRPGQGRQGPSGVQKPSPDGSGYGARQAGRGGERPRRVQPAFFGAGRPQRR